MNHVKKYTILSTFYKKTTLLLKIWELFLSKTMYTYMCIKKNNIVKPIHSSLGSEFKILNRRKVIYTCYTLCVCTYRYVRYL